MSRSEVVLKPIFRQYLSYLQSSVRSIDSTIVQVNEIPWQMQAGQFVVSYDWM